MYYGGLALEDNKKKLHTAVGSNVYVLKVSNIHNLHIESFSYIVHAYIGYLIIGYIWGRVM